MNIIKGAELMTRRKQITSLSGVIGALSFLIFISFVNVIECQNINLNDFRTLGKLYREKNLHFLSYTYNLSYFYLTPKSEENLQAGLDALYSCILYNRHNEAEILFEDIIASYPEQLQRVSGVYTYYLLRMNFLNISSELVSQVDDEDKEAFYRSYIALHRNALTHSRQHLSLLSEDFKYKAEADTLKMLIRQKPVYNKKYPALSLTMSTVLPGLGQFYAGSTFDALNSFSLNLITGIAAYASWRYELSKESSDRNYVLPAISSIAFTGFYITNLYNSVNIARKTNLYKESLYYEDILQRFNLIIRDQEYFLSYEFSYR